MAAKWNIQSLAAKKLGDPYKARCKVFAEDILVGLHGISALFSHADGTKHKERLPKDTPISNILNLHQVLRRYWVIMREIQVKHYLQSQQQ